MSQHVNFKSIPSRQRGEGPGLLQPTRVHIPNGVSIGSAVFARLTIMANRPTDRETDRASAAGGWAAQQVLLMSRAASDRRTSALVVVVQLVSARAGGA